MSWKENEVAMAILRFYSGISLGGLGKTVKTPRIVDAPADTWSWYLLNCRNEADNMTEHSTRYFIYPVPLWESSQCGQNTKWFILSFSPSLVTASSWSKMPAVSRCSDMSESEAIAWSNWGFCPCLKHVFSKAIVLMWYWKWCPPTSKHTSY